MKTEKNSENEKLPKKKSGLRENIEAIVVAVLLAMFIRTFVVQAFKIPSGSMKETLQIGDHILVNKFIFGVKLPFAGTTLISIKDPERGDVVVFKFPEDPDKDFIKRTVGIAGDIIEVRDKKLFVNGEQVISKHAVFKDKEIIPAGYQPRDNFGPKIVPENALFVMGDNRDFSYDSRFWGFVDLKAVRGKAFMIYWSWDKENFDGGWQWLKWWKYVRWNRFADILR